jgi:soluble cytochrome b562
MYIPTAKWQINSLTFDTTMEARNWIQKLVQIQLPELPTAKLDSIESSAELKDFLSGMNNMLLVICYDVKVGLSR